MNAMVRIALTRRNGLAWDESRGTTSESSHEVSWGTGFEMGGSVQGFPATVGGERVVWPLACRYRVSPYTYEVTDESDVGFSHRFVVVDYVVPEYLDRTQYLGSCRVGAGLEWSMAGPRNNSVCVLIDEPDSAYGAVWTDNFLCSAVNHGIRWSHSGTIPNMRCTHIVESASPETTWTDNYLCVPLSSPLTLSWSSAGPLPGKTCVQMDEPADPNTWNDNYLCYTLQR